jgi:hypothetical protein
MSSEGSFLVEDFINAITTQLDRVQDALRLKAVNRPLTYALKDISLDLQVFVEVDPQGNVKFRSSGPNEAGASIIKLGFTTITRPMIEENTVSLAMTRSPHLDELGLDDAERKQLEQLGVRNMAQLQKLGQSTGNTTVSRLTGIPVDRLKQALSLGKPNVTQVTPAKPPKPNNQTPPVISQPPIKKTPIVHTQTPVVIAQPPVVQPKPPIVKPVQPTKPIFAEPIKVAPGTKKLNLFGNNLIGGEGVPSVKLNNKLLNITDADEDVLVVEMPEHDESGALEVTLADGQQVLYQLSFEDEETYQDDAESFSETESREEFFNRDLWQPDE